MGQKDLKERTKSFALRVIKVETKLVDEQRLQALMNEADEIIAITVSSIKTAKSRKDWP